MLSVQIRLPGANLRRSSHRDVECLQYSAKIYGEVTLKLLLGYGCLPIQKTHIEPPLIPAAIDSCATYYVDSRPFDDRMYWEVIEHFSSMG